MRSREGVFVSGVVGDVGELDRGAVCAVLSCGSVAELTVGVVDRSDEDDEDDEGPEMGEEPPVRARRRRDFNAIVVVGGV